MKKQRKQAEQDANLLDGRLRCLRLRVMIEIKNNYFQKMKKIN